MRALLVAQLPEAVAEEVPPTGSSVGKGAHEPSTLRGVRVCAATEGLAVMLGEREPLGEELEDREGNVDTETVTVPLTERDANALVAVDEKTAEGETPLAEARLVTVGAPLVPLGVEEVDSDPERDVERVAAALMVPPKALSVG